MDFHLRVREAFGDDGRRGPRPLPRARRAAAGRGDRRPGRERVEPLLAQAAAHDDVWDSLVGQRVVADSLATAAGGHGMSQAWLFTGPPGSGRSNAAVAFAAALQCEAPPPDGPGCGVCHACHTVLGGSHADVSVIRTEKLSIGVDEVRAAGPPRRAGPGRQALADPHRRGRRPAHRPGLQRAAQVHRGAHRPHRLDPLRAHRRGRPPDDPVALPAGHPDHAHRGRGGVVPRPRRRRRRAAGLAGRARQPGPHRPGPRAGPRRGHPAAGAATWSACRSGSPRSAPA